MLIVSNTLKTINYKKALCFVALVAAILLLATDFSFAATAHDGIDGLAMFADRTVSLFGGVRKAMYIVGGFGIIGLSAMSIFGSLDWKWAGTLVLGLFLLAIGSSVIEMMTGKKDVLGQNTYGASGSARYNTNYNNQTQRRIRIMSKYTKDHEWALVNGNIATVGISIHAQGSLGDLVYVELPEVGKEVMQGDEIAVVESVKAASDVYSPLSGKIVEVNTKLEDSPELVNQSAELDGWIWKMEVANADELKALMSSEEYQAFIAE